MTTPAYSSHIVIVDDSPEIARLLAAVLRQDGYRVTTAHEVLSLEALRALAPDLIVHDLVVGDGDDNIWRRSPSCVMTRCSLAQRSSCVQQRPDHCSTR